jgi:Na+/proline symporter
MEMILGVTTLVLYGLLMTAISYKFVKGKQTAEYYTVADRKQGTVQTALSIAATWIWAPALFVGSTQAYNNGWVGLFWFLVPNILTLLFIIPFAKRLREKYPDGFTLSAFMGKTYNSKVQKLYQFEMGTLSTLSMSVNILAGGTVLSIITGIPLWIGSILLMAMTMAYTYRGGIKASLLTDAIQMIFILGALALFVPVAIATQGWDTLVAGLTGINNIDGLFTDSGIGVAVTFGIISAIGLFAGPIGDQSFWQRVFAVDKPKIAKSFALAALVFAVVPLSMSVFGFIAAGSGVEVANAGYVNLEVIQSIFPVWVVIPFLLMLLSGLLSTVDSQLVALGSLTTDYTKDLKKQHLVILVGAVVALLIANIPGNSVLIMFMIYGTLRASTFSITVLTLAFPKLQLKANAVVAGLTTAMGAGFPVFLYGNLNNLADVKLYGSLFTATIAGIVAYAITQVITSNNSKKKELVK